MPLLKPAQIWELLITDNRYLKRCLAWSHASLHLKNIGSYTGMITLRCVTQ